MESLSGWQQALSIATLARTRQQLRSWRGFALVASISVTFALISMLVGLMLVLDREPGPYFVMIVQPGASSQWWNYPGLLAVQPWGVLALPLWATISMVIVSIGVGLGMSIAVRLGVQLVRFRRTAPKGPAASGLAGALTPAMIALVTLGACCSTTAVSLASLGATAQVTGTTVDNLLFDSWYLPLFQIIVLWIALVAQEQLVRVYGPVIGLAPAPAAQLAISTRFSPLTARSIAVVAARVALIIAGATWGLALLAEWTLPVPPASTGAMWFQAVVQHLVPATAALLVGLFPTELSRTVRRFTGRAAQGTVRVLLGVSGASLVGWTPAVVVAWGVQGFVNGAFGELGLPASWGAVAPLTSGLGGWVVLALQYLVLGALCLGLALVPEQTLGLIPWGAGRGAKVRPPELAGPADLSTAARSSGTPHPASGGSRPSASEVAVGLGTAPTSARSASNNLPFPHDSGRPVND